MQNDMVKTSTINPYVFISIIGFLFSCINSITLSAWMIVYVLVIILSQSPKKGIEYFILLQIRSLLNPGLAVDCSSIGSVKWGCVFLVSIYIIAACHKKVNVDIKKVVSLFSLFALFLITTAFLTSSYPLVAAFKVLSYVIPFLAIIEGVAATKDYNYIRQINLFLGATVLGSIFLIQLPVGYLRNGRSLQGLFNHPNVLGVMVAIFIAGYLYENNNKRITLLSIAIISICFYLIYLSFSRTGMISFIIVLFIGIISLKISKSKRIIIMISILFLIGIIIALNQTWQDEIIRFLFKGGQSINDITNSRNNQFERNIERFKYSPFLGTGFNVPFDSNIKSYSFSFDLVTENGNLVLAILGDMGIIGMLLFLICYVKLFFVGRNNINGYAIYAAPFLVCMGEMSFFSTNNFGIILYLYFAIYMSDNKRNHEVITANENTIYNDNSVSI